MEDRQDADILRNAILKSLTTSPNAFLATPAELQVRPLDYWEDRVRSSTWAVVQKGNEILGIAEAKPPRGQDGYADSNRACFIDSVWIAPSIRQNGVGRHLVSYLIEERRNAGIRQFYLWVFNNNAPAIRLCERMDFKMTGLPSKPFDSPATEIQFLREFDSDLIDDDELRDNAAIRKLDREKFEITYRLLQATEQEQEQDKLGVALVDGRFRLISIQADGNVKFLDPYSQSHNLLYIASAGAYERKALIDELETFINSRFVSESQLQDFFERNPEFLCGDTYEAAHPHVVLQRPESGPLIPDFALKPFNEAALCDLLELKLPNARLVVGPSNRKRLSQAVMDACAQLREYRDYFDLPKNRNAVEETYGLRFFRPRMMVVIGRRSDYLANDLRKAESVIPELEITTYDDLLERARHHMRRRRLFS